MINKDYHVHSCYCDGKNTPEEIILAAIELGMEEIGIVTHSYTCFDTRFCIERERVKEFQQELSRLKEKYSGKLSILCGVEKDYYSDYQTDGFDYIIGSAHYIKCGDEYRCVDESSELLLETSEKYFSGDIYALTECYYETVSKLCEEMKPSIIGHFDLISKFNEGECLFSESDERYIRAWKNCLDRLLPYGIPFEINTGAISRGYRTEPYPSRAILEYIDKNGGKLLLSSDSHQRDTLCFEFEKWEKLMYIGMRDEGWKMFFTTKH